MQLNQEIFSLALTLEPEDVTPIEVGCGFDLVYDTNKKERIQAVSEALQKEGRQEVASFYELDQGELYAVWVCCCVQNGQANPEGADLRARVGAVLRSRRARTRSWSRRTCASYPPGRTST
jgi:hypothetical protein